MSSLPLKGRNVIQPPSSTILFVALMNAIDIFVLSALYNYLFFDEILHTEYPVSMDFMLSQ